MTLIGAKVEDFTSKSGKNIVFRYINEDDAEELCRYINELSKEDTFIRFSGEKISLGEEKKYIEEEIEKFLRGDSTPIIVVHDGKVIGHSSVERNFIDKKRGLHIGDFGLSVAREYRGDWIGQKLMETVIAQAKIQMHNLKIIRLNVYGSNSTAQNLYKKMGFQEFGRLPKGVLYKKEYLDLIEMYLAL